MRIVYGLLIILMVLPGCQRPSGINRLHLEGPLCGTWLMENATYTGSDLKVTVTSDERTCYKLMSGEHFAVIEMYKANPDSQFFAAVGTYETTDSTYTEYYEASNTPAKVGTKMVFKYELQGDLWTIENQTSGMTMVEHWERVSKPVVNKAGM